MIKNEIQSLDKEILTNIHEHAIMNKKTKDELANTHSLTKKLIQEIKEIKNKSLESEKIVQEMCKDIKTLDLAKKNITQSINCLGKFSDLITSLDNLRKHSTNKNYKEASHVLLSVKDLSNYFKNYKDIPQIKEVLQNKNQILKNLKLQINDEFSLYFKDMSNQTEQTLHDACLIVETLGSDFKKEIVKQSINTILLPYKELYERRDTKNIQSIEKRYVWFSRSLNDFKHKYSKIFPHYWGILCFIVNEFCGETSIHVSEILPNRKSEDVVSLIKALQSTINFETAMQKELKMEYEQYTKINDLKNSNKITQIPKIKGTISKCFENFTFPYVQKEKKELNEFVLQELNKDITKKSKFNQSSDDLNIFHSSLVMFKKIKFLLERVSKISRGKTMTEIYQVIKDLIKQYIKIIKEQIAKEEILIRKDEDLQRFILNQCVLINTVDYTKETINKMNDVIQNLIDEPYNQNLDFIEEEDYCSRTSIEIINSIVNQFNKKCDFGQMNKLQWEKSEKIILSQYVNDIKKQLIFFCQFKKHISNVYVIRGLKLISENVNKQFLENIFKFKKCSKLLVQRIGLDYSELKQSLFQIGMLNGEIISNIYNSVCERHCEKTESVIKLLEEENEIEGVISDYIGILSLSEISKILTLKCIKKNEINQIINKYTNK